MADALRSQVRSRQHGVPGAPSRYRYCAQRKASVAPKGLESRRPSKRCRPDQPRSLVMGVPVRQAAAIGLYILKQKLKGNRRIRWC